MTPADGRAVAAGAPYAVARVLDGRPARSRSTSGSRAWTVACVGVDAAMLAAAAVFAQLGSGAAGVSVAPVGWLVASSLLVLTFFAFRGLYAPRLRLRLLDDLRLVAVGATVAGMAVISARVLFGDGGHIGGQSVRLWAFSVVYLAAGRAALYLSQAQARRHGEVGEPTLILGAGRVGRLTAKRLLDEPELGLRPIGFIDKEPLEPTPGESPRLPVLGASWDLEHVIEEHDVRHVIVAFSTAPHHVLLRTVRRCAELGLTVSLVPRLFEKVTRRMDVEHLGGLPLLTVHPSNPKGWLFTVKYAADRVVAGALLLLASPFLAAAALGVLLTMGRPIFYRQSRIGLDGREFPMLKFRSMEGTPTEAGEADEDWAEEQLLGDVVDTPPPVVEDRTTPLGRILRRLSIDELPQLFNVLRGEMSLVGPRPERTGYVRRFEGAVYRYDERHRVKSGITGWAQVHGLRGKTSLADRVEWDNYYIENWSLWLDAKILLMTLAAIFRGGEGERA